MDYDIIAFAKECSEFAAEVAYIDKEGSAKFFDYAYGKTLTEELIEIFTIRKWFMFQTVFSVFWLY